MQDSGRWVLRKLGSLGVAQAQAPRCGKHGEWIDYLGRQLRLSPGAGTTRSCSSKDDGVLQLSLPEPHEPDTRARRPWSSGIGAHAPELLPRPRRALQCAARDRSAARIHFQRANALGKLQCQPVRCVSTGALIQAPPHIVDYVVAHELAHLKEMNHSARFWRIVERLCPGYAAARTELGRDGQHYMTL